MLSENLFSDTLHTVLAFEETFEMEYETKFYDVTSHNIPENMEASNMNGTRRRSFLRHIYTAKTTIRCPTVLVFVKSDALNLFWGTRLYDITFSWTAEEVAVCPLKAAW